MRKIKFLLVMAAFMVTTVTYAQFTNETKSSVGLKKGFRGIVEAGFSLGTGDVEENRPLLNVSIGYQFNPYIYVGGGVGGAYFLDSEVVAIPIFANFRSDFINYKISPFVDVKGGYSPYDAKGAYASVALGCRFNKFSLSFGYELFQNEFDSYYGSSTLDCWGYFAKIGLEF